MLAAALLAATLAAAPQEPQGPPPGPPPHAPESQALRVFLDCSIMTCDLDFLRSEVTFVSYVQDRADADVHALVTSQGTGGGGTEYTITFIGLRRLAGHVDTLTFTSGGTDTQDETRRAMAQVLRLGLVRYVAGTTLAQQLDIRYRPPAAPPSGMPGPPVPGAPAAADRWHHWTYVLSGSGFFNGEATNRQASTNASATATHVTDELWLQVGLNASRSLSRYEVDTLGDWFGVTQKSYEASASAVKSLTAHWSAGVTSSALQYAYQNIDLRVRVRPGIEYDVFPYSQTTRRMLTFRYAVGVEANRYNDTTIYGRIRETRPIHSLDVSLNTTQPWGSAFISVNGLQYLHDASKRELSISGNVSVRIVRGLSLSWGGGYSIIHDQLYLAAGGDSAIAIVARQHQLATSYSYFANVSLSYRFGSIFNNIVNRRFGGPNGSGGGMMCFSM